MSEYTPQKGIPTFEEKNAVASDWGVRENKSEPDEPISIRIPTPFGQASWRGKVKNICEAVTLSILVIVILIGCMDYIHATGAVESRKNIASVSAAVEANTQAIYLLTCIISRPESERKEELRDPNSTCRINNPVRK